MQIPSIRSEVGTPNVEGLLLRAPEVPLVPGALRQLPSPAKSGAPAAP
jgi:hypothetical protein